MAYSVLTLSNIFSKRVRDDKLGWIDFKYQLTEDDINQITKVICKGCRKTTKEEFAESLERMANDIDSVYNDSIFTRVIRESYGWTLCAAQDYNVDQKALRQVVLKH